MDDTNNQGMSNLSSSPVAEPKPVEPIVPGGPTVGLSSDPVTVQPASAMPSEPTFGVVPSAEPVATDAPKNDEEVAAILKRIEEKLSAIALKVGA
jgi:hypothetical protein